MLVVLLVVAYLLSRKRAEQAPQSVGTANFQIGQRTKVNGCQVNGPYQDMKCTPGAVFQQATPKQICVRGYSKSVRDVPYEVKIEAYREYGIIHRVRGEYEVDHLISLELGGSNDIANLWPEDSFAQARVS